MTSMYLWYDMNYVQMSEVWDNTNEFIQIASQTGS